MPSTLKIFRRKGWRKVMKNLIVLTLLVVSSVVWAGQDLPQPKGEIILTVTGDIENRNAPDRAEFDRELLVGLGLVRFRTSTPFTDGVPEFEGVLVRDILKAVGAEGSSLTAFALDDYDATIPISEFEKYDGILAMSIDGKELKRSGKGPL